MNFGDRRDAAGIPGVYDVALVHEAKSDAAGDGCPDRGVAKLDARIIDRADIRFDERFLLRHKRALRIDLLLRRGERAGLLKALEIVAHIGEIGFVLGLLRRRLIERSLKWSRIDLDQQVALFDVLAFVESDLQYFSVNAGTNRHRVPRLDVTETV